MTPRAVLFDLDNTLVHRARSIDSYASQFVRDFGSYFHEPDASLVSKVILHWDNGGYLPKDSIHPSIKVAVCSGLANGFGWKTSVGHAQILEHWVEYFPARSIEMPGATDLIGWLAEQGYALGVVSNGLELSRVRTLRALAFHHQISVLATSERIGARKPDPRIFLAAASELGVEPRDCWYVGDHPVNDCLGARAAGMKTAWLRGFHAWPQGQAPSDMELASLSGLSYLIDVTQKSSALT